MAPNILGLDPSFSATGYVIITGSKKSAKIVEAGWIPTMRDKGISVTFDDIGRIYQIVLELNALVTRYSPYLICTEVPLGSQSASAAKSLAIAKGIVATVCALRNITSRFINPLSVKLAVCGKRKAEKWEVIEAVENIYPSVKKLKGRLNRNGRFTLMHEARCDAIAVVLATTIMDGKYDEIASV